MGHKLPPLTDNDILAASQMIGRSATRHETRMLRDRYNASIRNKGVLNKIRDALHMLGLKFEEEFYLDTPLGLYVADFRIMRRNSVVLIFPWHSKSKSKERTWYNTVSEFKRYNYRVCELYQYDFKSGEYKGKLERFFE